MSWRDAQEAMHKICMDTFGAAVGGASATYRRGAVSIPFNPVFDNNYLAVDPDTGVTVSTTGPLIGVRLAELQPLGMPQKGDAVMIGGQAYAVVDFQPDSEGGADLILQEVDGS